MAGTEKGGHKAAATIRKRHGRNFYARIGKQGGMKSRHGGFASTKVGRDGLTGAQRAKVAGARGGAKSRRGKAAVRRVGQTGSQPVSAGPRRIKVTIRRSGQ